jgi:hypothetical protein
VLKQEHIRGNRTEMSPKGMEADLEAHKSWKAMKLKDSKRRTEGNIQINNCKQLTTTVNRYEVLAVRSVTSDSGNKLSRVRKKGNKSGKNNNSYKEDLMHNDPGCSDIKESHDEAHGETAVRHNLKNSRLTRPQANDKTDLNIHAIN